MGFSGNDLRFFLSAKRLGFAGKSICTLGHLTLFGSQREISKILAQYGEPDITLPNRAVLFADDVLIPLGYEVASMDASAYEGASLIHDLNAGLPTSLHERFDMVWDGGTLEHIFDFPHALKTAMQMVKPGGHLMLHTPANNQCGHGFYQFSPELFFRVMNHENGFELVRLYITGKSDRVYHVVDPIVAHRRVELQNSDGALLMVHAKKISATPDRLVAPQQSDYVTTWVAHDVNTRQDGRLKGALRKILTQEQVTRASATLNHLRQKRAVWMWKSRSRLSNRSSYVPVGRWDIPTSQATRLR